MANELEMQINPDNVPGAVTTGYQAQNNNLFILQTGLDTTEPFDNGSGVISVPVGGCVEANGVIFTVITPVALIKANANTAYWIAVTDHGNGRGTFELVTRPGVWDSGKKGCYLADGRRTLNWVSLGNVASPPASGAVFSRNTSGRQDVQLRMGWYFVRLASGLGGGNGLDGQLTTGGAGGVPSVRNTLSFLYFHRTPEAVDVKIGANGGIGQNGQHRWNAWPQGTPGHISGGGGGGGEGEKTTFGTVSTRNVQPGVGGGSGGANMVPITRGGSPGVGFTGTPGEAQWESGGGIEGDTPEQHFAIIPGGLGGLGGNGNGGGGSGGPAPSMSGNPGTLTGPDGGDGGLAGFRQPAGSPGGSCDVFPLGN